MSSAATPLSLACGSMSFADHEAELPHATRQLRTFVGMLGGRAGEALTGFRSPQARFLNRHRCCMSANAGTREFRTWVGSRLIIHAAFWGLTFLFFVLYFGREADGFLESVLFVALLLPVAMATTYFATGFLIPRFLLPGRYGLFVLYGAYALIGSIYLELVVLITSFMLLAGYDLEAMNPPALDIFGLVLALYVVVFLAVAANLAVRWHRLRAEHDRTERARLEGELALREAELARLKGQMQPHFLFNTLNNLYGLTLERSDDAPEVVLRISEMLDYVLYRCDGALVPLREEVEHLRTYLDLERLRYDERVSIQFQVEGELLDGCIAPLLLTPLVENSFKHGTSRTPEPSWVDIRIRTCGRQLHFSVENPKPNVVVLPVTPGGPASSGIGLENVKRRLHLLYPDAHELTIDDAEHRFTARLRVPIHSCEHAGEAEDGR